MKKSLLSISAIVMALGFAVSPLAALADQISSPSATTVITPGPGANDDIATFTFHFTITATNNLYIPTTVALQSSTHATPYDQVLFFVDQAGQKITSTNGTALSMATGVLTDDSVGAVVATCGGMQCYLISPAQSNQFTLTVAIKDAQAGLFRAGIASIPTNDGLSDVFKKHIEYFINHASDYTASYVAMN